MKHVVVIGLVGMPGAGKSLAVEALKARRDAKIVNMGDMVREQVTKAGLTITPENLGEMAGDLRKRRGPDVVAQLTAEKVDDVGKDGGLVVVDGLRSMQEVSFFRARWWFPVLAIHSPPATRHARMMSRLRADDSTQESYYKERDDRELKFGIAEVIVLADEMIVNGERTTPAELQEMASAAVDRLEKGRGGA
ncbi:MAG: AAA family ATPase [Candidatus Lokiarchaeota archaeon]|nr:AAA family ATPase [Candidatus Lokiarchaeota archaeon]